MKQFAVWSLALVLTLGLVAAPVLAQDGSEAKEEASAEAAQGSEEKAEGSEEKPKAPAAMEATVIGTNYCVVCASGVAEADMAEGMDPHMFALKISSATDAEGNTIEGMAGKTLYYLPTKAAADLKKGGDMADAEVEVTGMVYPDMMVVKVAEAAPYDSWDDWDDIGVGSMSGQPVI